MSDEHQLRITSGYGGALRVEVEYRGRVPDMLKGFPPDIQKRAKRTPWGYSMYEHKLLLACLGQPRWAVRTVYQHIYHQRAVRLQAKLERAQEREERRARRQALRGARAILEAVTKQLRERRQISAMKGLTKVRVVRHRPKAWLRKTRVKELLVAKRNRLDRDLPLSTLIARDQGTALSPAVAREPSLAELIHRDNIMHPGVEPRLTDWGLGR